MSLLIADAGSTKIHWAEIDGDKLIGEFFTTGVNPMVMPAAQVAGIFNRELAGRIGAQVAKIEYYGAGCKGDACRVVEQALAPHAGEAAIEVESDMLGACRCLLGRGGSGVVCILGTGANSCLYGNGGIVANVSPGGFILGDEGSGAWIGKRLLSDYLKGLLDADLARELEREYGINPQEIIRRVYRPAPGDDAPNRFLASFARFVGKHIGRESMRSIVECGFREFFSRNVASYFRDEAGRDACEVHFVGSVAKAFEPILREVAGASGYRVGMVARNPIAALTGRTAASE